MMAINTTEEKPITGIDKIAEFLGISERTVLRRKEAGILPVYGKKKSKLQFAYPSELNSTVKKGLWHDRTSAIESTLYRQRGPAERN